MTSNKLKTILQTSNEDADVYISNYHHVEYGQKELEESSVITKPKAVYIIVGQADPRELRAINLHYMKHYNENI